ncbi:unnamed protein product, partial [Trichogramma brassicae]
MESSNAKKRKILSVNDKFLIIQDLQNHKSHTQVCNAYQLSSSTVSTIWKNRDSIIKSFEECGGSIKKKRTYYIPTIIALVSARPYVRSVFTDIPRDTRLLYTRFTLIRESPNVTMSRYSRISSRYTRAWVRSPLGEFPRFVFSPGVVEPVPKVEWVPLKKKTRAMSSASEACECLPRTVVRTQKARVTHGRSTAVSDGLRSPQGQTSVKKPGGPSLMELGPLPTPRTSPYTMVKAITGEIIVAPLHCKEKDAKLPSPAEFATGTLEDKLKRLDGLIRGLGQFIQGRSNLHKEVISYQVSLGMALSALRKSLESQVPPRPPVADKAVCTSPLFTGSATSKRLATSPPASHATPKRHAVTPASKQHDENNNEVGDQDGFVLVDLRRHRQRKQTAATPVAVHARQQPRPRPVQRRARHRPDVIVIKAKDASKYADILRSLKSDPTLQQKVGSSVNNIRRSAAGALMLQLKKGVENASDLGEELGKVLGTAATASALLHTSSIEIKDLDECATKEKVTAALDALLGVLVSKSDPVKSLRKAYAGTQVAVVALPDDLAATALKLGHVQIGWVNCRIRAREEAARCYRCWSPGHVAARCKGPDRTELCYRCGQKGHQAKDCKGQPSCVLCRERGADDHRH